MKDMSGKSVRCAIYTRVSTDQGLEQDFNSLDAQFEASEAYIRSQAHAGWRQIRTKYDDGGFSGGNTDRPALRRLLDDVEAEKIDIIVVYKVDRLTRSLADFAKLVELFDRHRVSFVSVTQQFNTTTSMGRLTLNVLLSFAQFEREVTSERIRDKIAASKRKGLWVGGMVPLGYDTRERKITVNETEAATVRTIFERYLALGSLNQLLADLHRRGLVTKARVLKDGRRVGGVPFGRGSLAHLLRNRFYIGEVAFKGDILQGEQTAIIDRALFEAVQAKLDDQAHAVKNQRTVSQAPLAGRIVDGRGNRMTPTHARKGGIKYRYYIAAALVQGRIEQMPSVSRVSALEIESVVAKSLRAVLSRSDDISDVDLIREHVARVTVHVDRLIIALNDHSESNQSITVPWRKTPSTRKREILLPAGMAEAIRPIRSESRALLVAAIARGRLWRDELVTNQTTSFITIAERENCSARKVAMTVSLAFLAPGLVVAAIEGRLPHGIGMTRLCNLPAEWPRQYEALGLIPPSS